MRIHVLSLVAIAALLMSAAIYPPMIGGQFEFKVLPVIEVDASGVALQPVPQSIGIVPEGGGAAIACVATPDPARSCEPGNCPGSAEMYTVLANVSATGTRQAFNAVAYLTGDCTESASAPASNPSANTGYTYPGMSPRPPDLQ